MDKVNVSEVVDNSRFNRFHVLVVALCGLAMVFDGYELGIYGAAVPSIIGELGISPVQAGAIGSYSLMGMAIGAPLFGTLSDRTGRKPMIVACVAIYAVFTGIIFFSSGPTELGIYRFLAGLGLGGVMPNLIALSNEYSPKHLRSTMVSVMFSGWFVGVALAALLSIWFIPAFGWRSVFLVGGLVPLVLIVPLLIRYLPDSLAFYLVKGKTDEVAANLQKIDPTLRFDGTPRFEVDEAPREGLPLVNLFRGGYAFATVMFWTATFMGLLVIYGLQTWLPQLMINAGYALTSSLTFLLTLVVAGLVITWSGSYLSDKLGRKAVLIAAFVIGGVFIALLGFAGNAATLYIYAAVALGGGAAFSAQVFVNAYIAQYYPTNARSTGVGWSLGVGRIGAIIGPLLGGVLLAAEVPLYGQFLVFGVIALIAAVAVSLVRDRGAAAVDQESAISGTAGQGSAQM